MLDLGGSSMVSLVRMFYYAQLFGPSSRVRVVFIGLVVLLESFLIHGIICVDLLVLIPLTAFIQYFHPRLQPIRPLCILLILISLGIHASVIDSFIFLKSLKSCVSLTIFGIYSILLYIVLAYILEDNRGNRLV